MFVIVFADLVTNCVFSDDHSACSQCKCLHTNEVLCERNCKCWSTWFRQFVCSIFRWPCSLIDLLCLLVNNFCFVLWNKWIDSFSAFPITKVQSQRYFGDNGFSFTQHGTTHYCVYFAEDPYSMSEGDEENPSPHCPSCVELVKRGSLDIAHIRYWVSGRYTREHAT